MPAGSVGAAATTQLRGSTLLLGGRLLSLALNTVTQVLVVRALTKPEYGAFAYALTISVIVGNVLSLGQRHSVARFLALYAERRQPERVLGTLVVAAGTIMAAALPVTVGLLLLRDRLQGVLTDDPLVVSLLVVVIFLAPVEALDDLLEAFMAASSRPLSIFFRKYVLAPLLRLSAAGLLVVAGLGVRDLAYAYVAAAALGVASYAVAAVRIMRAQALLGGPQPVRARLPVREVFAFSLPLLSTELVHIGDTLGVLLLGWFGGAAQVAAFRAVLPAATLNLLVINAFTLLFVPTATRLLEASDREGLRRAYWQSTTWIAALTFPVFALTGPLAAPTTVALFGERYASSAVLLGLLALGNYVDAALGCNVLTLQIAGRLRWVTGVNLAATVLNVALSVVLVPPLGALGVALAVLAGIALRQVAVQVAVHAFVGVGAPDRRQARLYATVVAAAAALAVLQLVLRPPVPVAVGLAALTSVVVLGLNRRVLDIAGIFPELARIPVLRRVLR